MMRKSVLILYFLLMNFSISFSQESLEREIESLLSVMTLKQKIGQMNQLSIRKVDETTFERIKRGEIGSVLNMKDTTVLRKMQKIAVEQSELGIPIVFARDVIHGFKTVFPIPLAQAASFNPGLVEQGARIAAVEASEMGIQWTFAPMMDVSRDPRWGRIAESFGEDTFLTEEMAVAMVKGFQGNDLSLPSSLAACAKHFVAYGAVEGGKDYNTTNIPERQLRKTYFPPFEQSIRRAKCATLMPSFNSNDGIPPTANHFLLSDVLRNEWQFDGVVVSDWEAVTMMISQGFAADRKEAAMKSALAGVDLDMSSNSFFENLEKLVIEKKIDVKTIDNAVRNILRLKFRLGLFKNPYARLDDSVKKTYSEEHLKAAKEMSLESFVLLKNKNDLLPLSAKDIKTVAVIGPMADAPLDQLGTWSLDGDKNQTVTPLRAIRDLCGDDVEVLYEGVLISTRDTSFQNFDKAIEIARKADVVLLFVGEESILSGEARCLANLNFVGAQSELLETLASTQTPIVTVVMAGRPLTIEKEVNLSDAILYAWHPGTMGGVALADVLFGRSFPSGKLPVTFPRSVGQIPVYYNYERVGRPAKRTEKLLHEIPLGEEQTSLGNTSYYLDLGFDPLFYFGYGLSYTTFEYSNLKVLNKSPLSKIDTLRVSVDLKNTGKREGCEVVQVYISDASASVSVSNKDLRDFKRVTLQAGESKTVLFNLPIERMAIWNIDMEKVVEAGMFKLIVGGDSQCGISTDFFVE